MEILLLGRGNSITQTIEDMISSVEEWNIRTTSTLPKAPSSEQSYDVILANLDSFTTPPRVFVRKIKSEFPDSPLLVVYSYSQPFLIQPLLESGATGYLQEGLSEAKLFECVRKVSDGEQHIFTENTY